MMRKTKPEPLASRPQPLREDPELRGGIATVDCAADPGRRAFIKSLDGLRRSGCDAALLYNFDDIHPKIAFKMIEAARAMFALVKIEFTPSCDYNAAFISQCSNGLADEIILKTDASRAHEIFGILNKLSKCAPDKTAVAKKLKASFDFSGETRAANEILEKSARCGLLHVILRAPRCAPQLPSLCKRFSDNNNITIELLNGNQAQTFRSAAARDEEAKRLLLDIPFCECRGLVIPLGAVIQLNFSCNQHCVFCTTETSLPRVPPAFVRKTLAGVLLKRAPRVVFTGGEPTIDRNLPEYIQMCADAGTPEISVYTNGMALSSTAYTRRLASAGANLFLISLHSRNAEISDRITRTPGGFAKTTRGISNAIATGALVTLNFVINELNYREAPDFVVFASKHFPGAAINFSYVAPILDAAADMRIVPGFSDAAPHIIAALDEADRLGVDATGLEPHRGIPPCALNADTRYFPFLPPLMEEFTGFVKSSKCRRCRLDAACPGVRKNYASLRGLDELRPLR